MRRATASNGAFQVQGSCESSSSPASSRSSRYVAMQPGTQRIVLVSWGETDYGSTTDAALLSRAAVT